MIKLIFCDMDGTLLTPEGNLPDGFDDMMKKLKERNCIFVPASGRQYGSLADSFVKYKDDMIFLSENGTFIKDGKGKEYFTDAIPPADVHRIIAKARAINQPYFVLSGTKSAYIERCWDEKYIDECVKYYSDITYLDKYEDFDKVDDEIVKIAVADCDSWEAETKIYHPMKDEFKDDIQTVLSSSLWVDLMNVGAGKGKAVTQLRKQLGFKEDECAVFGDYLNDYTMMQSVYYSHAMANAHEDLKKVARFVIKSNAEFGVVQQVNEYIEKGMI